jgi:hypothetical protein
MRFLLLARATAGVLSRAALMLAGPRAEAADTQPFLFTVASTPNAKADGWTARYLAGYGERVSQPFGFDGVEQGVGVEGPLGRGFTLRAQAAFGFDEATSTHSSQQVELLKDVVAPPRGFQLALGAGLRREWEGVEVLLGRISLGRRFSSSDLFTNLRFERAFAEGRDGIDLIVSAGWQRRLGAGVSLGVETVAEDLEGFWEHEEAEGGARVFVGPSAHYAPPGRPWSVSVAGGPLLQATTSTPARARVPVGNGVTVRFSAAYAW